MQDILKKNVVLSMSKTILFHDSFLFSFFFTIKNCTTLNTILCLSSQGQIFIKFIDILDIVFICVC